MRGLRSTLVMLVLFVALGGYAYFVESERPPASQTAPNEQVFDFEADDVAELRVTADGGEVTHLERASEDEDGDWKLTSPIEAGADDTGVSSITRGLASLEIRRVVEEQASDLALFGLTDPAVAIAFRTGDDTALRHLLVGDTTPTGADRYATTDDSDRVFLIADYLNSTFNRTTFDLRDKTILDFTSGDVDGLAITAGDETIRFDKTDGDWRMRVPRDVRTDFGIVDGLIGRLSAGQMRSIEAEATDDLEPYGLDDPGVIVTLEAGSATVTLSVGDEAADGTVYARDASRSLVFTIERPLVTDLERDADAYREKDLFSFRPFNATRLQVARADGTVAFERIEAPEDSEAEDGWQQVDPEAGDVEQRAMDDLLAKLSNLRAESFVAEPTGTGLDAPLATIEVRYGDDGGEAERVTIGRAGDDTYAVHGDELGAAVMDTRAVDEALDALDALQTQP